VIVHCESKAQRQAVMKEQVEREKVWIDLYPKQEVLLQSLEETLEMTVKTLLIIDGSTNYELAKHK
jgi:hypothetical protein